MKIKVIEPRVYDAMTYMERTVKSFELDEKLVELIKIRVSQINGCGYCLNMHARDARKIGETDQRIDTLAAWWETPFFSPSEMAALRLAEEVTRISDDGVSDSAYDDVIKHFGEQKTAQLILAIIAINGWNRIAVATHLMPE